MAVFLKIASLGVVIGGGSLLSLWLATESVPLAMAALAATGALAVGVIALITRETRYQDRVQQ